MTIRVAILGAGFIADLHLQAAAVTPGVEVVAIANHRRERAAALAERHGIPRVDVDWRATVAAPDVDAVVICTPNALHAEQAIAALATGKHVLVEKPMATSAADAHAMADAAAASGLTLQVGHMWRYHADVIALRDRIASGGLGRIVRTHGWSIHAGWGPSGWFCDPALAGGGALIDMGVHAIDTARFLLGDPAPRRVQASVGTAYGDYAVDDDGLVLIDWEGGVRSLVEFGWWQPRMGGLEADTEVLGTAGAARLWQPPQGRADVGAHLGLPMFVAQLADFAGSIRAGTAPAASAAAGVVALEIALAAYAAAGR